MMIGLSLLVGGEVAAQRVQVDRPSGAPPVSVARPQQVRLWRQTGGVREVGLVERLTPDSVVVRRRAADGSAMPSEALAIRAMHRVEVAEPLTQREALRRGGLRGALVGLVIGGALVALDQDAVGTAVGVTIGTAWAGAIIGGQQTDSPRPPVRWRRL